ncbi:hypothetical protein VWM73_12145, partial [Campylobacter coli]
ENKGVISARVTIDKKSTLVPLSYTIENNKFVAKGQLDLHAFKGKQLLILRYPLLWISILCVVCINAGIWGFYSYFSDFLLSISK